jgi:death-on-curing family protein
MEVITLEEVEYVAFSLARELLTFDEPIPDFSTRFPNILESCVLTPFQEFSGKRLYPTLVNRAAILFYLMIKNHPFQNGNKRIALTTLMTFLSINDKWLKVDIQKFYNFTVWVAQSPAEFKKQVVSAIEEFVQGHFERYLKCVASKPGACGSERKSLT